MAKKRKGHEMIVYYGTAGSTAATPISANVVDVDPGGADFDFVDLPDRGDGSGIPHMDEYPVKKNSQPSFSMIYHDSDTNMTALLAAADANPPVGKAIKVVRVASGETAFDGDCWLKYSSAGPLSEGQTVEFECHPTSAYGRLTFSTT
jgi:hypothetical protein